MVFLNCIAEGALCDLQYNETSKRISPGDKVIYIAHLPGGNVKIKKDDCQFIAHPDCFAELR